MHYDHISFHLDENYPHGLPESHAAHHMGYYYAWAVSQNLHNPAAAALPGFEQLQNGRLSGAAFVQQQLGGGLDDTCFNDLGKRFTLYYYYDEEEGYGKFIEDYFHALGLTNNRDFYRTQDTAENQQRLSTVFQVAFERWQNSLR
ncbi:MAG: hypothetical protein Q4A62_07435 [Eikenella sp.]|nr:hypothetical protein [Eikenella sp.]